MKYKLIIEEIIPPSGENKYSETHELYSQEFEELNIAEIVGVANGQLKTIVAVKPNQPIYKEPDKDTQAFKGNLRIDHGN